MAKWENNPEGLAGIDFATGNASLENSSSSNNSQQNETFGSFVESLWHENDSDDEDILFEMDGKIVLKLLNFCFIYLIYFIFIGLFNLIFFNFYFHFRSFKRTCN